MTDLPEFRLRILETEAAAFRVSTHNRLSRTEMTEIAAVNLRTVNVCPTATEAPAKPSARQSRPGWRSGARNSPCATSRPSISIAHLYLAAHWAQRRASDADLDAVTDRQLPAKHDL